MLCTCSQMCVKLNEISASRTNVIVVFMNIMGIFKTLTGKKIKRFEIKRF